MAVETSLSAVEQATELTIAWLNNPNNRAAADEVPAFLRKMHETVTDLGGQSGAPAETKPAADEGAPTEFVPARLRSASRSRRRTTSSR